MIDWSSSFLFGFTVSELLIKQVCCYLIHLILFILSKVASIIRFKTQCSSTQPSPPGHRLAQPSSTTMPCHRRVGHTLESAQRQHRQTRLGTIRCITRGLSNLHHMLAHSTPMATSNVSVIKNLKRRAVTLASTLSVSVCEIDSTKMWWAILSSKREPRMVAWQACTPETSSSWRSRAAVRAKASWPHRYLANQPLRHSPEAASRERVSQVVCQNLQTRPAKLLETEEKWKRTWMISAL